MLDITVYMSIAYFVSWHSRKIENSDKSIWISHCYMHIVYVWVRALFGKVEKYVIVQWLVCSERKISPNSTFGLTNFYKIFNSDILSWCAQFFFLLKYNFIIQWACFSFPSLLQCIFIIYFVLDFCSSPL